MRVFIILIIFWHLMGCEKNEERILAKVGKAVLTESQFYSLIPTQMIGQLTPGQKRELLKKWIDTELVYQQGIKENIHKDPEIKLKLKELERELIANKFLELKLAKVGGVDEWEIREYFESHKEDYNTERKAAQIVVSDSQQAVRVMNKLHEGEKFSEVAKKYSIDPSAQRGGVMGYIRRGDMPQLPEFEEALFNLKKIGDISGIVKTVYGYHIIKLLGVKKLDKEVEYETVKESLREYLIFKKQKRVFSDFLEELRKKTKIEANYHLLE
jgi:peptidyl-prolyl cis-trans isomerase C